MDTLFDFLTVGGFLSMSAAFLLFTERDTRTLVHLLLCGLGFAVANQLGNAESPVLGFLLLGAAAMYAALVIRSSGGGDR